MTSTEADLAFLSRVRDTLPTLHPSERRLAEFILDFPGELASYSAAEVAKLAEVSGATVSRFIRRLGYRNYEEARRHVREEKEQGSALFLADRATDSLGTMLTAHLRQGQENMQRVFARLNEKNVQDIARAITGARKIWITGARASRSLAAYFQWQLFQVREECMIFPGAGESFGEYLSAVKQDDVVVVIGLRRRPGHLQVILERLVETGAKILFISDEKLAFNARVSWHIQCPCDAPGPLDNHVAPLAVLHLLLSSVIETTGTAGRQRLAASDNQHDKMKEFQLPM
ncbi:MurR/RpiR family transcriptional regulator [Pseudaminobacter sp. NGMCC 1.201702]|uniref:MurR/RpiR family transcriptional regulator n=1 Tax=Pseudaminobacter sp. NGMCC 1.201702 TaxID=3391825 RepID=UPI0039EE1676